LAKKIADLESKLREKRSETHYTVGDAIHFLIESYYAFQKMTIRVGLYLTAGLLGIRWNCGDCFLLLRMYQWRMSKIMEKELIVPENTKGILMVLPKDMIWFGECLSAFEAVVL